MQFDQVKHPRTEVHSTDMNQVYELGAVNKSWVFHGIWNLHFYVFGRIVLKNNSLIHFNTNENNY